MDQSASLIDWLSMCADVARELDIAKKQVIVLTAEMRNLQDENEKLKRRVGLLEPIQQPSLQAARSDRGGTVG